MSEMVESSKTVIMLSPCSYCKHKSEVLEGCTAFDTIPDEILFGKNKHTKPLKGQKNKIIFEKN